MAASKFNQYVEFDSRTKDSKERAALSLERDVRVKEMFGY